MSDITCDNWLMVLPSFNRDMETYLENQSVIPIRKIPGLAINPGSIVKISDEMGFGVCIRKLYAPNTQVFLTNHYRLIAPGDVFTENSVLIATRFSFPYPYQHPVLLHEPIYITPDALSVYGRVETKWFRKYLKQRVTPNDAFDTRLHL